MIINVFKMQPEDLWFLDKDDERLLECASANEISSITILDLLSENFKFCNGFELNDIPNKFIIEILPTTEKKFIVKLNGNILKEDNDKIKLFNNSSSIGQFIMYSKY